MYGFLSNLLHEVPQNPIQSLIGGYTQTSSALNQLQQQRLRNAMQKEQLKEQPQKFATGQQLSQAQINKLNAQTQQMPQQLALRQRIADLNQRKFNEGQTPFGQAYRASTIMRSFSNPASKAAFQIQHPEALQQIQNAILSRLGNLPGGAGQPGMQGAPGQQLPSVPGQQQAMAQQQVGQINQQVPLTQRGIMQGQVPNQAPQQQGMPAPQPAGNMGESEMATYRQGVQQTQKALASVPPAQRPLVIDNMISRNKAAASPLATQRLDSAITAETMLSNPRIKRVEQNAAKYAGLAGKGKAFLDSFKKGDPQGYADYLEYKNVLVEQKSNLLTQMEKMSVSPSVRERVSNIYDSMINNWTSNPARARGQMNRIRDEMRALTRSLSKAAQPVYHGVREIEAGLDVGSSEQGISQLDQSQASSSGGGRPNISNAQLLAIAKQRGLA